MLDLAEKRFDLRLFGFGSGSHQWIQDKTAASRGNSPSNSSFLKLLPDVQDSKFDRLVHSYNRLDWL